MEPGSPAAFVFLVTPTALFTVIIACIVSIIFLYHQHLVVVFTIIFSLFLYRKFFSLSRRFP
jgi:hypothetical protein